MRTKTHEEAHMQYLFKMMEIAKQGDVADDALVDYVIAGITNLYCMISVAEFKSKLQLYVKMKSKVLADSKKASRRTVSRNFRHRWCPTKIIEWFKFYNKMSLLWS